MLETAIAGSIRRHVAIALGVIVLLLGGLTLWAARTTINSAVIAPGRVVVESNSKQVQHQDGGIVKEIHVREGGVVQAGELLVRLDDAVVRANLTIIGQQLDEALAQEARLIAERDGTPDLLVPAALQDRQGQPDLDRIIAGQNALMQARRQSLQGREQQLSEQIAQFENQIGGLEIQRDAKAEEIRLIDEELEALEGLFAKGLLPRSRLVALRRDKAKLEGDRGNFIARTAQVQEAISERRIMILQLSDDRLTEVLEQLQTVRATIAQLTEEKIAVADRLHRNEIRAPRTGYVHQLAVHTIGGVVRPGETLMLIVPQEDLLVIEAQVRPTDIDQLRADQPATIRLTGFDLRTTPELNAHVQIVTADLIEDEVTKTAYYRTRLALDEGELAKLNGQELIAGMPVDAFIRTDARTVLSFLVEPLTEQIAHAFREG